MIMIKDYSFHRNAAISWMNSSRDFDKGIAVLEASGFRPAVVLNLKRRGAKAPAAMARLKHLMRSLISAWAKPGESFQDTDVTEGIIDGNPVSLCNDGSESPESILDAYSKLISGQMESCPEPVKNIISEYRNAYVKREILHKELSDLGESNDDEICEERKKKSELISSLSKQMDVLYPQFLDYFKNNKLPESDLSSKNGEQTNDPDNSQIPYSEMSAEDLKKLKKSLATKILRAVNRLNFQQETKADEPNPMPDGPERVKYETKIRKLSAEVEDIKMELAKRG